MSYFKGKYIDQRIVSAPYINTSRKAILVSNESNETIGKCLASINIENVEDNKRVLHKFLFNTPSALQKLSGVILFEETMYQKSKLGKRFCWNLEGR